MRVVQEAKDFLESLTACQNEGRNFFSDPDVLLEKFISAPRHVEVQVFCDNHGNGVYL